MSVPPDKLVATLGLRLPELGLVFTGAAVSSNAGTRCRRGFP